jgi:Double sensory domain of two-component sensor kinase
VGHRSIRGPLAVSLLLGVVLVALAAATLIGFAYEHDTEAAAAGTLRATQGMFQALQRSDEKKMDAAIGVLLEDEELRRLFLKKDRAQLLAAAQPRFADLKTRDGITHWYFIDADRRAFLRVHKPDLFGDVIDRLTLAMAARTRNLGVGLELGQTAFALRVVRPWIVDGTVVGYIELAEEIDHFLTRMKQETGNEYGVLMRKRFLDEAAFAHMVGTARNTWNARSDVVVLGTTSWGEGLVDYQGDLESLPAEGLVLEEEVRGARAGLRALFPIEDAAGRTVGALIVLRDITALHDLMSAGRRRVLVLVLGMSLFACLVVWATLEWYVLQPMRRAVVDAETALQAGPGPGDELERLRRVAARLAASKDGVRGP